MSRDEFFQEGQTPIPFDYVDLYMPLLAPLEWQILSCAMRLTWGEGKREAFITIDQFRELGGVSQGGCIQALKKLKEYRLLVETSRTHQGVCYAPQLDAAQIDLDGLQVRRAIKDRKGKGRTGNAQQARLENTAKHLPPTARTIPDTEKPIPGFVYLASTGEGHYKIGMSTNPQKRIAKLGKQSPFYITLLHVIPVDDMARAENHLHRLFADRRGRGEWFTLSDGDAIYIKSLREYRNGSFSD